MKNTLYISGLLLVFTVLFLIFEINNFPFIAARVKALVVPSICVLYIVNLRKRRPFFELFLVLFSVTDLLIFTDAFLALDYKYYIGNTLYIIAYLVLIYSILRRLNIKNMLSRFKLTFSVLLLMNIYVLYSLLDIDILFDRDTLTSSLSSVILEFVYNAVTFSLFMVSFLNYLYKSNKESLFMFIGSLCVVFSEVFQYATSYPSDQTVLNIVCYVLIVLGFLFFYLFAIQGTKEELTTIEL